MKGLPTILVSSLYLLAFSGIVPGEDYTIDWYTVDGGGVMFSAGGEFELSGTIGQPEAGVMGGGDFTLSGGFWFPLAKGDCNWDGGVNLVDFDTFALCLEGLGSPPDDQPQCACFDLDGDGDVDLGDAAEFINAFTGGS